MDTIFWNKFKFDENGGTYPQSKSHFTQDLGKTTLCKLNVPNRLEADTDSYGDSTSVECKKCQRAYESMEKAHSKELSTDHLIKSELQPTEEEINQWLRDYPQVGTLTDGRFYISTPQMTESPFYEVVQPLQKL